MSAALLRPRLAVGLRNAAPRQFGGAKIALYSTALAAASYAAYLYTTDTRASFHRWLIPPAIRLFFPDAEDAHHVGTAALKFLYPLNLHPRERDASLKDAPELQATVFGTKISNPIGNPKPRVFRVTALNGMVNRYGLNSRGADNMSVRLRDRLRRFAKSLGVTEQDIAKNKETDGSDERAVADDHVYCVKRLARYADILVVNVSSPNTPGLRDLQATGPLTRLLSAVVEEAAKTDRKQRPKVMVKVSPDEDDESQVSGIVTAVLDSGVDGIIVGNTTKRRDGLLPATGPAYLTSKDKKALTEEGGFSGPAMFSRTLNLVKKYNSALSTATLKSGEAEKVIFATGGITNGEQALKVLNAGASVAMVYTGMVYGGAGTITRIKSEMRDEIKSKA
uniref:Dihydroorotate dehydrogenase catalytic domain-containing protein n=1 Tax=Bionectria ochroleuca TaxID=29856 RepID=A0A0B7K1C5_BIOOC